ncbi:MAG: hypothetical protein LC101_12125 [Flavobacteriales bacterium]|nr:hypothetical protein [Flavobacteriales bacterium]
MLRSFTPLLLDMSYSVPAGYVEEDINEDIREALGDKQNILESVEILSETAYKDLLQKYRAFGIANDQRIFVRITLRHLIERSFRSKPDHDLLQEDKL